MVNNVKNINEDKKNKKYKDWSKEEKDNSQKLKNNIFDIFDKYVNLFTINKNIKANNNYLIYSYIKNNYNNKILNNNNFHIIRDSIIEYLENSEYLTFDNNNKKYVFTEIVDQILKYKYLYCYKKVEECIKDKKPIYNYLKDEILIQNVKNKDNLFGDKEVNIYKDKIAKELKIELPTEDNIITKYTKKYIDKQNTSDYNLPGFTTINIINKAYDTIKSKYALQNKGIKANTANYLPKNSHYNVPFYPNCFKIIGRYVRLTVGDDIVNNISKINYNYKLSNEKKKYFKHKGSKEIDPYYLYVKLPKKLINKNIKLMEVIYIDGSIKIVATYDTQFIPHNFNLEEHNNKRLEDKLEKSISIDLGMKNLMTIYNPSGEQKIIKGYNFLSINEYYNKRIGKLKSNKATNKKILNEYNKREHQIKNEINKVVSKLVNEYENKDVFIVGYNSNWKNKINIGKNNNRKFTQIPHSKILQKLEYKLKQKGKILIKINESYTSKCSATSLEEICKKDNYKGKRVKRGLYKSKNRIINADLNGAINIMRKVYPDIKKIKGKNIYSPTVIKI
jgi:IS605 OrfB family transposase